MTASPETPRLVLASASPARLRLLRDAGFDPEVVVSQVAEGGVGHLTPREQVEALAIRKARAVAARLDGGADRDPRPPIIVACDSMLEVDGVARGKPGTARQALEGWRTVRGRSARLHTGHCVILGASGAQRSACASATVRFASPTDAELDAYVASGEPLAVAGGFTIDGRGAAFVAGIDGHPGTVIGLSLPLLRELLGQLGVALVDLWR